MAEIIDFYLEEAIILNYIRKSLWSMDYNLLINNLYHREFSKKDFIYDREVGANLNYQESATKQMRNLFYRTL
jgi:hypothetical protein